MTKYEIARWVTPGLTPVRLVFTTYGGSAHGEIAIETQDIDSGEWDESETVGLSNVVPKTKGEKVGKEHINQFTGEVTR